MDISIITDAELLVSIDRFIAQHGMPPTTFGRLALGDGDLLSDLREGRSLRLKSVNKVVEFVSTYEPDCGPPINSKTDDTANRINPKGQRKCYSKGNSAEQAA